MPCYAKSNRGNQHKNDENDMGKSLKHFV
jgi:hypothetical protein